MTLTVEVQLAVEGASVPSRQEFSAWARAAWRDDAQDAEVVVRVPAARDGIPSHW